MTTLRERIERLHPALAIEPGHLAVLAGVRGAIATVLPLVLGAWLGLPNVGWTALGSFTACLADSGGSYRSRASTYGALAVVLVVGIVAGSVASATAASAIVGMFLWCVVTQMLRVYPSAFGNVTVTATVAFAVAVTAPYAGVGDAVVRAAYAAAGVLLAMVLALGSAPIRFYRPARLATARCYRLLAARCAALSAAVVTDAVPEALRALHAENPVLRNAINDARAVLGATRTRREGESQRGELLVMLTEAADQIYATTLAVLDVVEAHGVQSATDAHAAFGVLASGLERIAVLVESERAPTGAVAIPSIAPPPHTELGALVARCDTFVHAAAEGAAALGSAPSGVALGWLWPHVSPSRQTLIEPLRANLTFDSVVLRHALRLGVVGAVGAAFVTLAHVPYGEWVLIAIAIVLQPYSGATTVKGVQRLLGTACGGAIAAVVGSAFQAPAFIFVAIFALAGISVALYPLSYAAYAAFMTPTFVLLAELHAQTWHLALMRFANNLIGALLALLGALVLWPSRERPRVALAGALHAVSEYLAEVLRQRHDATAAPLPVARRRVNVALANASGSLQRFTMERGGSDSAVEVLMAVLTYVRRLAVSITALAVTSEEQALHETLPEWIEPFERGVVALLGEAHDALLHPHERTPGEMDAASGDVAHLRALVPLGPSTPLVASAERIGRQLMVLRDGVRRASAMR